MCGRICGLGIVVTVSLALTGRASAHAHLEHATPSVNGIAAQPLSELDLSFSEGLDLRFTGLKVTGADGVAVPTGEAKLSAKDHAVLVVPISGSLAAGTYTVDWHALSIDGHRTEGSYSFVVKP